jgi:hypothetical protein
VIKTGVISCLIFENPHVSFAAKDVAYINATSCGVHALINVYVLMLVLMWMPDNQLI